MSLPNGAHVLVSVASGTRRVDLALPGAVPVAELVPGLARSVGLLDVELVHEGYRLLCAGGRELAPDAGLTAQGVEDGAVLTVTPGAVPPPRHYDDVVDAMTEAVERDQRPWSPAMARRSTLAAAALSMVLGAWSLAAQRPSVAAASVAGLAALGLLAAAGVLSRRGRDHDAAVVVAWSAACYAVASGLSLARIRLSIGGDLASAGVGAMVAGGCALLVMRAGRALLLPPFVVGAVMASAGLLIEERAWDGPVVLTCAMAGVVLAGSGFPSLALGLVGTDVDRLVTVEDITAVGDGTDAEQVRLDARTAHEILLGLFTATGVVVVAVVPLAVSLGVAGTLTAVACCLLVALRTRRFCSGTEVLAGRSAGVLGLGAVGVSVILLHPSWQLAGPASTAVGAVLLAGTLLPPPRSVRRERLGDLVESLASLSVLPLLVVATGLLDAVRRWR